MFFVSYAQNYEDAMLNRVFGGQPSGFYIDIGAYHPSDGSVTRSFYDRGWIGINVEPGSIYATLAAARTRDTNLRLAVLDHKGQVPFVEDETDQGVSHVGNGKESGSIVTIDCDTLDNIVRDYARGRPIDFIKIDAEGSEAAIVSSTNWRSVRPRVLLIESTLPWSNILANDHWEPILLNSGYVRVYFDGINCFYVPEEELQALERHFYVPINVLDGSKFDGRFSALISERDGAFAEVANMRSDLIIKQDRISQLLMDQSEAVMQLHSLQNTLRDMEGLRLSHEALTDENAELQRQNARLILERDNAMIAYEKMSYRCDLLGRQHVGYANRLEDRRSAGVHTTALTAVDGLPQVTDLLSGIHKIEILVHAIHEQAVVWLPTVMDEVRRGIEDRAGSASLLSLAEEMERAILTLAMEATTHRPNNDTSGR